MKSNCRSQLRFIVVSHLKKIKELDVSTKSEELVLDNEGTYIDDFIDDIMAQFSDVSKENETLKDNKKYDERDKMKLREQVLKLEERNRELEYLNNELKEASRARVKESEVVQELQRKLIESEASNRKLSKAIIAIVECLVK